MTHTIAHASLVAVLLGVTVPVAAQTVSQAAANDDPFARRGWHLELAATGALEAWNYNLNHEEILGPYFGLTYGVGKGVVLTLGWPLYYVSQRGVDGVMLGATWGARGRLARRGRASFFWDVDVGFSESDTFVPPRGTRFNFLAEGSGGATVRVARGVHVVTALKWIHVSNGGVPAGRDRNPDIEAVGLRLGMLVGF